MKYFLTSLSLIICFSVSLKANIFEWDAGPQKDAVLSVAQFRMYVPEEQKLRATLILLGGRNSDFRNRANNQEWQAFADTHKVALMACFLKGTENDYSTYQLNTKGKTSQLLNKAIEELAQKSNHPELSKAPVALQGISAGANVSVAYAGHHPDRTIGVVAIIVTNGFGRYKKDKDEVPILTIVGAKDKEERIKNLKKDYAIGQKKKALWTFTLHPDKGHTSQGSKSLADLFLTYAISNRLEKNSSSSNRLKKLSRKKGWLGNLESYEIASYSDFKGKKKNATWLPNEETAKAWQTYLKSQN